MKQITEKALLFRVNQLKEKIAMFEGAATGHVNPDQATVSHGRGAPVQSTTSTVAANQKNTAPATAGTQGIPGGVVDQAIAALATSTGTAAKPAATTQVAPAAPTTNSPPLSQLANPQNTGAGPRAPAAQTGTAAKPGAPAQAAPTAAAGKWPTTDAEIKAFQKANKDQYGQPLKVDGLIGAQTMQALARSGIQPPAGFQMAGNKQPAAQHAAHQGTAAKPAAPAAAANPEDAARDARIAQNQAFYNLSPEDQAAINQAHGQAALKTAAATQAAQTQAAPQTATTPANPNDPTNSIGKAVANAIPNAAPSSAPTAQGPLGINFPSQQIAPQLHQGQGNGTVGQVDDSDNNLPPIPKNESVSFANEDSLTRILQLANW